MNKVKHFILPSLFLCLFSVQAQEKFDWKKRSQEEGANFYQIREEISKKLEAEENNKLVEIISKSSNIKVVGENEFVKFRRWEWNMSQNIHPDGSFPSNLELQDAFDSYVAREQLTKNNSNQATWNNISRTSNDGGYWSMGRTSAIGFHPNNANIFWVCSETGGVWKTTDGGSTYSPQGDNLPYLAAGTIVVDHQNPNILYLQVGKNTGEQGIGIYKSTNGGDSWAPTNFTQNLDNYTQFYNLVQSPSNTSILLIATNKGIYRTENAGTNWSLIRSGNATDVQFKVNDGNMVYANINGRFYRSIDKGRSFDFIATSPSLSGRSRISVSKSDVNKVLIWASNGVWVSNNNGSSWDQKNRPLTEDGNTIEFESMQISPNNPNILYGGLLDVHRSDDNGNSWTLISKWHGHLTLPEVHADHRNLTYHPLTGRIYSCNDGGIDSYNENSNQWFRHSNGLVIPQYYSAASAETNGNIIGVGSQDNGGSQRDAFLNWKNTNGGDAGTQAIDPSDSDVRYSNYNPSPNIIRTTDGWLSTKDVRPSDTQKSWWVLPYILDPINPKKIVAGYHAVYTSNNRGDNWKK